MENEQKGLVTAGLELDKPKLNMDVELIIRSIYSQLKDASSHPNLLSMLSLQYNFFQSARQFFLDSFNQEWAKSFRFFNSDFDPPHKTLQTGSIDSLLEGRIHSVEALVIQVPEEVNPIACFFGGTPLVQKEAEVRTRTNVDSGQLRSIAFRYRQLNDDETFLVHGARVQYEDKKPVKVEYHDKDEYLVLDTRKRFKFSDIIHKLQRPARSTNRLLR